MEDVLEVETLESEFSYKLRLEIYLRNNALKVKSLSKNPEKFDNYIAERERIIRSMVGEGRRISDRGRIIYP